MDEILAGSHNENSIGINCTWGEGADVSVNIGFNQNIFNQSIKTEGRGFLPIDLTAEQAIEIGMRLSQSGSKAKRMREEYHKDKG